MEINNEESKKSNGRKRKSSEEYQRKSLELNLRCLFNQASRKVLKVFVVGG